MGPGDYTGPLVITPAISVSESSDLFRQSPFYTDTFGSAQASDFA